MYNFIETSQYCLVGGNDRCIINFFLIILPLHWQPEFTFCLLQELKHLSALIAKEFFDCLHLVLLLGKNENVAALHELSDRLIYLYTIMAISIKINFDQKFGKFFGFYIEFNIYIYIMSNKTNTHFHCNWPCVGSCSSASVLYLGGLFYWI